MPPAVFFRAGAGAVILDARRQVLACERVNIPGAWQMPQGGLEEGEAPLEGAWREVREETGLRRRDLELLAAAPGPLAYELPPEYRTRKTGLGQVQYWFLFRLKNEKAEIDLGVEGEFRAWKWIPFAELIESAAPFRRPLYQRLAEIFAEYLL